MKHLFSIFNVLSHLPQMLTTEPWGVYGYRAKYALIYPVEWKNHYHDGQIDMK